MDANSGRGPAAARDAANDPVAGRDLAGRRVENLNKLLVKANFVELADRASPPQWAALAHRRVSSRAPAISGRGAPPLGRSMRQSLQHFNNERLCNATFGDSPARLAGRRSRNGCRSPPYRRPALHQELGGLVQVRRHKPTQVEVLEGRSAWGVSDLRQAGSASVPARLTARCQSCQSWSRTRANAFRCQ